MITPFHALVWICKFIWSVICFLLGLALLAAAVLLVAGVWIAFNP